MKMRNRIKKHSLKLISLFFAIFLWAYVLNSEKVRFEKTVALDYILPEDMIFAQRPPLEVSFMIEGPRAFVRTVVDKEERLVIDLNKANSKKHLSFTVDINPEQLDLPFGMIIERVVPRKVPIRLERKASKIVPIKAMYAGELPSKMRLVKRDLIPQEVEVYGPRSLISQLKEVQTRPIDQEQLNDEGVQSVELFLSDDRLNFSGSNEVKLHYKMALATENMVFKKFPIKFLTRTQKVQPNRRFVELKLSVPENMVNERKKIASAIQVWADIPDNIKDKTKVPLKVVVPPEYELLDVSPKDILVNTQ